MNIPLAMTTARVMLDPSHGWTLIRAGATTFWFKGHERMRDAAGLVREAAGLGGDRRAAEAWLRNLDGHFALVIETPGWTLAAADRVGSIPLIWTRRTGEMLVTQDGPGLERALGLGPGDINPDAAVSVALAGYTIGADTLYRGVHRLTPGQYLWIDGDGEHLGAYHRWRPWLPSDAAPGDLVVPLISLHERIVDKLVAGAGGRPILVPLSAGLDSRLILSGLIAAGYRNVRAFTYGLPGNREALMASRIAARLGVDWTFIPYDVGRLRRAMATTRHRDYESYADVLTGIHFPQDWLALTEMMAQHGVGPDTIVVNGQTGDFITGNHILPPLTEPALGASPAERMERILAVAIAKHFKLWHALQAPRWLDPVRRRLREDIEDAGGLPEIGARRSRRVRIFRDGQPPVEICDPRPAAVRVSRPRLAAATVGPRLSRFLGTGAAGGQARPGALPHGAGAGELGRRLARYAGEPAPRAAGLGGSDPARP